MEISVSDYIEATRRGNTTFAVVWRNYVLDRDVVVVDWQSAEETYLPLAKPAIVNEIAKIQPGDTEGALSFVSRWGLLGYADILGVRSATPVPIGDPLPWVWAHANGIRAVLRLHSLLQRRASDVDIEDELSDLGHPAFTPDALEGLVKVIQGLARGQTAGLCGYSAPLFAQADKTAVRKLGEQTLVPCPVYGRREGIAVWALVGGDGIQDAARRTIETIINDNLLGVSPVLTGSKISYRWDALISVIYFHLAGTVAGGRVGQCQRCGAFFCQTDGRQRFCPPRDPYTEESYCASIKRSRKFRERPQGRKGEQS